jgi:hypothetical protein
VQAREGRGDVSLTLPGEDDGAAHVVHR